MGWTQWQKVEGFAQQAVLYDKKYHTELLGGVARITINRPERMNTFSPRQGLEMGRCFADASEDPMIGVVVLTGAGDRAFSAGGDVEDELKAAEDGSGYGAWGQAERKKIEEEERKKREVAEKQERQRDQGPRGCRKPVIARVNGFAIGGGHHLAYRSDLTIAADHAIFGQNGARVGSAISGGTVAYLSDIIGMKRAREIWYLCRRYSAQQALAWGLVNAVVPYEKLDEEVDKYCEEILQGSPSVIEGLKESFDRVFDRRQAAGPAFNDLFPQAEFYASPEGKEGQKAFLEKRQTRFWQYRKDGSAVKRKDRP